MIQNISQHINEVKNGNLIFLFCLPYDCLLSHYSLLQNKRAYYKLSIVATLLILRDADLRLSLFLVPTLYRLSAVLFNHGFNSNRKCLIYDSMNIYMVFNHCFFLLSYNQNKH